MICCTEPATSAATGHRTSRSRSPALRAAAQAQGVPAVAAALLSALEPAFRAVGGGLLGLDHPAGGDDADPVLGLAAVALAVNAVAVLPVLRGVRASSVRVQAAGAAVQVSRQVPIRAEKQGILVREPEPRQHPAHVPLGRDDLDGGRGARPLGVRQRLRAVAGFAEHPLYLAALALAVPVIHEVHFYCIHRLIHIPVLYKWVHSVHHRSINASPWSSLSMHPLEHLLYFSDRLLPPDHSFEPAACPLPDQLRRLRRHSRSCGLRQDRGGRDGARRQPRLRPSPPPQVFRGELWRGTAPARPLVRHLARRLAGGRGRMRERQRRRTHQLAARRAGKAVVQG